MHFKCTMSIFHKLKLMPHLRSRLAFPSCVIMVFPHTVTSKCDLGVDWISSGLKLNQEDGEKFTFGLEQYLVVLLDELFVQNKREAQTVSPPTCFHCATARQVKAQ